MSDGAPDALSVRMAAAAREMQDQSDAQATYESAVDLMRRNVDACDAVGITLVHTKSRSLDTPAATQDLVLIADRLQYETGEGPCLDVVWEQRVVVSPSLGHDQRWRVWGPKVVEQTGYQSALCFRVFTQEHTLGAMNLYAKRRDAFSEHDREEGLALAAHIAIAITGAQRIDDLRHGLDSRTAIGQATGIVMERFELDPVRAFGVLARLSQQSNRKLREVAVELIQTRILPN